LATPTQNHEPDITFLYLPAQTRADEQQNKIMKTILIIEDDTKIAMALSLRLKSAGYETPMAHDALTGLQAALKHKPDLVLLDISMPAGNGFSVAERIQALVPASIPIIFLTASKQPGFRERAMELGAAGFFEKPFKAETLLPAIRHALGEKGPVQAPISWEIDCDEEAPRILNHPGLLREAAAF
jgi:CheY-like chemotaxis protein